GCQREIDPNVAVTRAEAEGPPVPRQALGDPVAKPYAKRVSPRAGEVQRGPGPPVAGVELTRIDVGQGEVGHVDIARAPGGAAGRHRWSKGNPEERQLE